MTVKTLELGGSPYTFGKELFSPQINLKPDLQLVTSGIGGSGTIIVYLPDILTLEGASGEVEFTLASTESDVEFRATPNNAFIFDGMNDPAQKIKCIAGTQKGRTVFMKSINAAAQGHVGGLWFVSGTIQFAAV